MNGLLCPNCKRYEDSRSIRYFNSLLVIYAVSDIIINHKRTIVLTNGNIFTVDGVCSWCDLNQFLMEIRGSK